MSYSDELKSLIIKDAKAVNVEGFSKPFYVKPLNCRELAKIQAKHKDFLNSQTIEGMVDLIILKALDDKGDPAFKLDDKPHLMSAPVNKIAALAGEIMGSAVSVEEMEKN